MTDPTERLAEAIEGRDVDSTYPLVGFKGALIIAQRLTAQGFGHREDHVPAFALWQDTGRSGRPDGPVNIYGVTGTRRYRIMADRYLASLAAKEEDG